MGAKPQADEKGHFPGGNGQGVPWAQLPLSRVQGEQIYGLKSGTGNRLPMRPTGVQARGASREHGIQAGVRREHLLGSVLRKAMTLLAFLPSLSCCIWDIVPGGK